MRVRPAKCDLYRRMKLGKRDVRTNLEASPDSGLDFLQFNVQGKDVGGGELAMI